MKHYIDKLREEAAVAETNRRQAAAQSKRQGVDTRILCDTPLTDQIEALMRSLPPAQRNRPFSMEELVLRLQGRYSAGPHPMNIGLALRRLKWRRERRYGEADGRRLWYPPSN